MTRAARAVVNETALARGCPPPGEHNAAYFQPLRELAQARRRKRALLCGCGPSMNAVDSSNAALIADQFDVWATNQFFVHRYLVPRFMHVEFKPSSLAVWQKYFDAAKQSVYANTTFLVEDKSRSGVSMLKRLAPGRVLPYDARRAVKLDAIGGCDAADGLYAPTPCTRFLKKCSASATVVLQFLALLYDEIWFLGVDLVRAGHFWTDNPLYPPELAHFKPTVTNLPAGVLPKYSHFFFQNNRGDASSSSQQQQLTSKTNATSSSSSSSSSEAVVHATALRGFHLFLDSFVQFNHVAAVNLSPYSASILGFQHASVADLTRCLLLRRRLGPHDSPSPDGDAPLLRECVRP